MEMKPDLQYRFKKAGWKVYFQPASSIIHFGGRSMDRWKRRKMVYRGKMLFYQKNYGFLRTFLLRPHAVRDERSEAACLARRLAAAGP